MIGTGAQTRMTHLDRAGAATGFGVALALLGVFAAGCAPSGHSPARHDGDADPVSNGVAGPATIGSRAEDGAIAPLPPRIVPAAAEASPETIPAQAPAPPAGAVEDDLAALAQKTNNPISDAWLLITQNDTTLIGGNAVDGTKVSNVTKFQPVLSAPMFDDSWNLVVRPVFQFASQPLDDDVSGLIGAAPNDIAVDSRLRALADDPSGRTTGLGDTVLLTLIGPNGDSGWIYAAGASQIFPSASEDVLGQGKWQAGPAGLVLRLGDDYGGFGVEHFNFGFLAQQWWSYAGDGKRKSTSQADIQYFINWKATPTQLIGMTPNISINWNGDGDFFDKMALPIGLGTIGLVKIGKLPIRWGIEAQYYLTGNENIKREANFRFFIAPIIPNPLKS